MLLAISHYHEVAGQKQGLSVPPEYRAVAGYKVGDFRELRVGKTLRNTFPFSEQAGHHQHHHEDHDHEHHHHHEDGTSNARSLHGSSVPGQGLIPPQSGIFTFINI